MAPGFFRGPRRRNCGVAGGVFTVKVALLFGIPEDAADLALAMAQRIATEQSWLRNVVKYPLYIAGTNLTHPKAHATTFQVIRPYTTARDHVDEIHKNAGGMKPSGNFSLSCDIK
jgi:hypothetical protein